MRHLCRLLSLCLLLGACRSQSPLSQGLPLPADTGPSRPPTLLVQATGDTLQQPLRLADLSVELRALAGALRVTLELTYQNPYSEELEGTFFFPLANGQVVDSFALEVDGQLRSGVIVPREKGRQVFEQVAREGIDPALLSWQRGNAFQARVYPILAGGTKRIRLGFTVPMDYQDPRWTYQLPLVSTAPLDRLQLTAQVSQARRASLELQGAPPNPSRLLSLTGEGGSLKGELTLPQFGLDHTLRFSYQPEGQGLTQASEVLLYEGEGGETWFAVRYAMAAEARPSARPTRIGLLWDLSRSALQRDLDRELAVLAAYLADLSEVEVRLLPFRHEALPIETYQIEQGDSRALQARLRSFHPDGATNFAAIDLERLDCETVILASDGVATWQGRRLAHQGQRIHVLSSGSGQDLSYLRALTSQSGGGLVQADDPRLSPAAWAQRAWGNTLPPLRATTRHGLCNVPVPPQPGQPWLITGRLTTDQDTLTLSQGERVLIQIPIDKPSQLQFSDLPRRLWASQRLQGWLASEAPQPEQVIALAQAHGLVTPFTSLLVLDRVEDYVRFEVDPPPSLRNEVLAAQAKQQKQRQTDRKAHLDQVAEDFAQRVAWWETSFTPPPGPYQDTSQPKGESPSGTFGQANQASEEMDMGGFDDAFGAGDDSEPLVAAEKPSAEDLPAGQPSVDIKLAQWQSGLPYQAALQAAPVDSLDAVYRRLTATYGDLPAFYADAASVCLDQGATALGLRILSNLAELAPDNLALLRVLGYRLQQMDSLALAEWVLGEVLRLRPDEPQSHRDLGLVMAKRGHLQAAIERLYEVVKEPWDGRFSEIGVLAAHEINSLVGSHRSALDLSFMDERLIEAMPTDLRVVLTWDANDVDLDLWVTDPRGEKCFYQNRQTDIGGLMSRDFTGGYGPEEFLIKEAMPGTYQVQANYYANKQASLTGPATLRLRLIRDYGRPSQQEKSIVLRLGEENEVVEVGRFEVEE